MQETGNELNWFPVFMLPHLEGLEGFFDRL